MIEIRFKRSVSSKRIRKYADDRRIIASIISRDRDAGKLWVLGKMCVSTRFSLSLSLSLSVSANSAAPRVRESRHLEELL